MIAAGLLLLLLIPISKSTLMSQIQAILAPFLKTWEGFLPKPKWDVKQWSWGYGTRVPGSTDNPNVVPGGTISRERAFIDALAHIAKDLLYLASYVTIPLSPNQWAALLSFSYNLGTGNAMNLMQNINSRNKAELEKQWKSYNKVRDEAGNLVVSSWNTKRRAAEWELWKK